MVMFPFPYPVFQKAMRVVTAITNSYPCLVTTSFAHNYITGQIVRIVIPPGYGMYQMNQQFAVITVTGTTTFTMPIDTTLYDAFVVPPINPGHYYTSAQAIPIAEQSSTLAAATVNVLNPNR